MRWDLLLVTLLLSGIVVGPSLAQEEVPLPRQQAGKFTVILLDKHHPNPPIVGHTDLLISVAEGDTPLEGAEVTLDYGKAGATELTPAPVTPGAAACDFHAAVDFDAPEAYTLRVTVRRQAGVTGPDDGTATFTLTAIDKPGGAAAVASAPSPSPSPSPTPAAPPVGGGLPWVQYSVAGVLVVVFVAAVVYRLRKKVV